MVVTKVKPIRRKADREEDGKMIRLMLTICLFSGFAVCDWMNNLPENKTPIFACEQTSFCLTQFLQNFGIAVTRFLTLVVNCDVKSSTRREKTSSPSSQSRSKTDSCEAGSLLERENISGRRWIFKDWAFQSQSLSKILFTRNQRLNRKTQVGGPCLIGNNSSHLKTEVKQHWARRH